MEVYEKEIKIPRCSMNNIYKHLNLETNEIPIRFVVTESTDREYHCEVGVISDPPFIPRDIFKFFRKEYKKEDSFNVVLIIPTGIGAEIGGHAGDANPVAKLIASSCDTLITHPNVVNASEYNELPNNAWYVEGSVITRLLMGQIGLQKSRSNKIMLLADKHKEEFINDMIVNAANSARTLGIECDICFIDKMVNGSVEFSKSGRATGRIENFERLLNIVNKHKFYDAFALSTGVSISEDLFAGYFNNKVRVNPWGGYESILTHSLAELTDIPCAHAPMLESKKIKDIKDFKCGIVDPRKAPEILSSTWLYCILKGLHRSPRIVLRGMGLCVDDIDCLIIPDGCIGLPTLSCLKNRIPIIVVEGNKNIMRNTLDGEGYIRVKNYAEASGVLTAMRNGISLESIDRPIGNIVKLS